MNYYILDVSKKVDKIIGVKAKNSEDAKRKALKMIANRNINFDIYEADEVVWEIGEFYSPSLEKKLTEVLGEQVKERSEKFSKLAKELSRRK